MTLSRDHAESFCFWITKSYGLAVQCEQCNWVKKFEAQHGTFDFAEIYKELDYHYWWECERNG